MTLEQAVQIGTLISVAIAAIGLIFGVIVYSRQMNAQLLLEYTKRYEEIMSSLPSNARTARFDLFKEPPAPSEEITTVILRYLNMSSEEFYLQRKKYLSKPIWSIWEDELVRTLQSPLVKREWDILKVEFKSYPEFYEYVEQVQNS
jgi:hypothetical protein